MLPIVGKNMENSGVQIINVLDLPLYKTLELIRKSRYNGNIDEKEDSLL